jgi:hypothetical protein
MTPDRFEAVTRALFQRCYDTLVTRAGDYAAGDRDRLHNFKVIARRKGCAPEKAALFLQEKQSVALEDYVEDMDRNRTRRPLSDYEEKIVDIINYHVLTFALIADRAEETGG